ncbi:MAG: hypothetical protein HY718_13625 [Planctomycetes bacterium]|nr:hypothetical protein [Planctomycetota bacterium]
MSDTGQPVGSDAKTTARFEELPADELILYGRELGLTLDAKMERQQLLLRIRERQALLKQLDHDALLDIVVWARRPVRKSISKEELAREIACIKKVDAQGLSRRGLVALMRLRGIAVNGDEPTEVLGERLRTHEPFWDRVTRHRRRLMGGIISHFLEGPQSPAGPGGPGEGEAYKFLPEDQNPTLRDQIAEEGVVSGLARRIRGAADDYVREKLDEIELRIDRKLEEIDRRLAEWRDREIANRLRIIRITLVASILVALLSLGYSLIRPH